MHVVTTGTAQEVSAFLARDTKENGIANYDPKVIINSVGLCEANNQWMTLLDAALTIQKDPAIALEIAGILLDNGAPTTEYTQKIITQRLQGKPDVPLSASQKQVLTKLNGKVDEAAQPDNRVLEELGVAVLSGGFSGGTCCIML
jgi:hypothetical protein